MTTKDTIILNVMMLTITFGLILFWFIRVFNTACFSWVDYTTSFGMLFINSGLTMVNIKELRK